MTNLEGGGIVSADGVWACLGLLVYFLVLGVLLVLAVRLVRWAWGAGAPTKKEVEFMRRCKSCNRWYDLFEVESMLEAMGFGPGGDPADEDYLVLIDGLCPVCWPEYH